MFVSVCVWFSLIWLNTVYKIHLFICSFFKSNFFPFIFYLCIFMQIMYTESLYDRVHRIIIVVPPHLTISPYPFSDHILYAKFLKRIFFYMFLFSFRTHKYLYILYTYVGIIYTFMCAVVTYRLSINVFFLLIGTCENTLKLFIRDCKK